jgi:predicted TIM-barrel enzyme
VAHRKGVIIKNAFDDPYIKDVQYEITELEKKMIITIAWIE